MDSTNKGISISSVPGIFILSAMFVLYACEKPEGPGGNGVIYSENSLT